jgi:hypothetical protein
VRFPVGLALHEGSTGSAIAAVSSAAPPTARSGERPDPARTAVPAGRDEAHLAGAQLDDDRGHRSLSPLLIGLTAGGALIAVAAAVVLGLWWSGRGGDTVAVSRPGVTAPPASSRPTPESRAEPQDLPDQPGQRAGQWTAMVRGLVGLRAQAFERADPAIVDLIFIDGSPAARADSDLIAGLRQRGQHTEGYRLLVRSASVASRSASQVRLHAVTQQRAYTVVSGDGARERTGSKPPLEADIVLRKAADGYWRIYNW